MNSRLVAPDEAARILSVSRSSIYRMMNDGSLSSVKIRRARRIPLSDIEQLFGKEREAGKLSDSLAQSEKPK